MPTIEQILTEARSWQGTAFQHQQRTKGVGVDCTNFIAAVAENSGATKDVEFAANYRRREDGVTMLALLRDYLDIVPRLEDVRPADILALCDEELRRPDIPRHLILVTEVSPQLKGIHASEKGVVEHRLPLPFQRRIHSIWRLRTIDG